MRLSVQAADLKRIVSLAGTCIQSRTAPVLQCLKFEARDNTLYAYGTDMDTQIRASCEAAVAMPGEALVNFADVRAITNSLRGVVSIELDVTLQLKTDRAHLKVGANTGEFPALTACPDATEIISGTDALRWCASFAANEKVRPNLNGVMFEEGMAIATNGHRLTLYEAPGDVSGIIPRAASDIAAKVGGRLFISGTLWRIEAEGVTATGRTIDYAIVPWQGIVFDAPTISTFDADEMIESIKMATVGRAAHSVIEGDAESIAVSGDRFRGENLESMCSVRCDGEPFTAVLDTSYALECLAPMAGCVVNLSTNGRAVKFQAEGRSDFTMAMILRDRRTSLPVAA